jgi:hypothetical protein
LELKIRSEEVEGMTGLKEIEGMEDMEGGDASPHSKGMKKSTRI